MKNFFQLSVLLLSLFLLSGFTFKTEKNHNNTRSFSTEKEDLLFKSGSEEIKKLLIKGPDVFEQGEKDPLDNKTGLDIDSKAKELNVDRNDLSSILNQISSESVNEDSIHTDALNQQVIIGYGANNYFGFSVSVAGDINGDGYADIIVGAYGYSSNTGRAYLYLGSPSGINTTPAAILTGEATGNYFGFSVSVAGDVNGDGYADIIVGADGYSSNRGRAYLYLGSSTGIYTTPTAILTGETTSNFFGGSVSAAGDVNGDGFADIIVGARGYSSSTGRAYLYHGSSSGLNTTPAAILTGVATSNYFSYSISGAGDVNGDGYSDIIVGAYGYSNYTGRAYLYHGSSSGINTTPAAVLSGEAINNYFGASASGAGDVNGDGYADIIVGANGYSLNTGRAYLYLGSSSGINAPAAVFTGEATNNYFGGSVSGAGDVNGDGYSDIIVAASLYSSSTGRAYLYLGRSIGINTTPTAVLTGEATFNYFGRSVSGAGDLNGDGYADIIVGAYGHGSNRGKIYIYSNSMTGNDIPDYVLNGETTSNNFGFSVSGAGDVNGDGYADIIVGANEYNNSTGRVYIYIMVHHPD